MAAGRAINKWNLSEKCSNDESIVTPKISIEERDQRYQKWKKAVERSLGWDI